MTRYLKDPEATLDYKFNWLEWLDGDTIATQVVTIDDGATVESSAITDTNTSVTAFVSGGTVGRSYVLSCNITTVGGRPDDCSLPVLGAERYKQRLVMREPLCHDDKDCYLRELYSLQLISFRLNC